MIRKTKTILLTGLLVLGFSLAIPIGAFAAKSVGPIDWMAEISEHIDVEYTERLMEDMVAIGSSDLGFRGAGTQAEHDTVDYILDEMTAIGLEGVDKEPVPVHAWEFISAKVSVESPIQMEIVASSFAGVQGTEPLTGELVYVGSSYSSEYEGLDVEGKIVLSNWDGYNIWIDAVGMMAYIHGAAGIIVSCMDSMYGQAPYALQCHDANWDPEEWPPMVYIAKEYGWQLVEMLENGEEVIVTMESEINLDFDGVGYNTIGYIPGKNFGTEDDSFIIIGDHHDAWFTGAGDDTSGTAATLAIAKAIIDASYQPERTLIFTTHTAEEYGTTNVYFDWCVGAWYQITREHPDWAGKAIAYLNLEIQGLRGCPFGIDTPVDLFPFINKVVNSNKDIMPHGVKVNKEISTWNDGWTFTAAGVPGITTASWETKDVDYELSAQNIYHTQYDNMDAIDFEYMGPCLQMNLAIVIGLDQEPIIPYSFVARATDFYCTWDASEVASTGVDPDLVDAVDLAVQEFEALATEWQSVRKTVPEDEIEAVNTILLEINKIIEDGLTAMDVWEISRYPHEQSVLDSTWLQTVIDDLKDGSDPSVVKSSMRHLKWWVGQVWYYDYLDYEVYITGIEMITTPDNWGEQIQLGEIVDTWDVVASLEEKLVTGDTDFSAERAMLQDAKLVALENLENALNVLLTTFTDANALLQQIV